MTLGKNKEKRPMVSVIIAVFNGEGYIEDTIKSIINQTYESVELIIIDGGSTDNTVNIVNNYINHISYFVSESDSGISNAFNKGIKVARGKYINFQGDGDGFWEATSLERAMSGIDVEQDVLISCRIARVTVDDNLIYYSRYNKKFCKQSLLLRMSLPHQGLLTHRKYFDSYGDFDESNKFCMDYEHLLRAYNSFPKVVVKNIILARWRYDGLGNGREKEIYREYDKIKRMHRVAPDYFLNMINMWILFKYYLKKMLRS